MDLGPDRQGSGDQFALSTAFLASSAHLAVSLASMAPSLSGGPPNRRNPSVAARSFMSGSASTRLVSALILAMTSLGVPFGAKIPYQLVSSTKPMPVSRNVGTSGNCSERAWPDTASARTLPALMLPIWPPSVVIHNDMRPDMM